MILNSQILRPHFMKSVEEEEEERRRKKKKKRKKKDEEEKKQTLYLTVKFCVHIL